MPSRTTGLSTVADVAHHLHIRRMDARMFMNRKAQLHAMRKCDPTCGGSGADQDSSTPDDPFEYAELRNTVLQELDDNGVARAYPVRRLLRYIRPRVELTMTKSQHWFRALACHIALCRSEDHCRGRPLGRLAGATR